MMLSKSSSYGLRAALYVALHPHRERVSIKDISQQLNISFHFLTKILQLLTRAGLLSSITGPHGGVQLARDSRHISLRDIIQAIEGPEVFSDCLLGLYFCHDRHPCPVHHDWQPMREQINSYLANTTLAALAQQIGAHEFRLTHIKIKSKKQGVRYE